MAVRWLVLANKARMQFSMMTRLLCYSKRPGKQNRAHSCTLPSLLTELSAAILHTDNYLAVPHWCCPKRGVSTHAYVANNIQKLFLLLQRWTKTNFEILQAATKQVYHFPSQLKSSHHRSMKAVPEILSTQDGMSCVSSMLLEDHHPVAPHRLCYQEPLT